MTRSEVVEVKERRGPRGGVILVMRLSCGHLLWQRRKTPPTSVQCVPCWLEAEDE